MNNFKKVNGSRSVNYSTLSYRKTIRQSVAILVCISREDYVRVPSDMADNKKSSEKSEKLCLVCVLLGMFCDSLDYYYIIEWYWEVER